MARHCSKCGKSGHYVSTCGTKKLVKKSKTRRYSNRTVTRSRKGYRSLGSGRGWIILYHGGRTGKTQHDKTWSAKISKKGSGYAVVTRHGRRVGQKNESTRSITTLEKALCQLKSLVSSKLRKGYMLVGARRRNPHRKLKKCSYCGITRCKCIPSRLKLLEKAGIRRSEAEIRGHRIVRNRNKNLFLAPGARIWLPK